MSNSIVGNNANPTECYTWYETEVGDDEYEDLEGELVDEENVFGHRAIVPKNSNSTSVTIFYYYLAPTSSWYWDYSYGDPYKPVIPVVFAADSKWQLTQCLNTTFIEHTLTGQSNGWKSFTITLTRKLVEGERIFFGVYSDLLGYTSTGEIESSETTTSYFYWTRARRRDYANQITYLSSPEFINQQRNIFCDYEMCIYMQYEKTINKILQKLSKELPIAEEGDLLETQKTLYPLGSLPREEKNIIINSTEVTPPLACSKEWKNLMEKEKAPLCQIYKDVSRGDILKVKKIEGCSLIVENLSIDEEFRKDFKIDKIEIAKKNFSLIRRKSIEIIRVLEQIGEDF